ncbi:MAG: hypothetical protein HDT44_00545 [Ruminococcaceae bacterium]|nr:hypothetical protein [Oscillospiraceae bacterium]
MTMNETQTQENALNNYTDLCNSQGEQEQPDNLQIQLEVAERAIDIVKSILNNIRKEINK